MSDDLDPNDLPAIPDGAGTPAMDADLERANAKVAAMDDDQMVANIGKRTSNFGRIVALVLLGTIGALGYVLFTREQAREHRWDVYRAAQEAETEAEFLRMVREELPRAQFDDVRMRIMVKLGQYRDPEAVPLLVPFLDHGGRLRYHAARALARIGSPAANAARPDLLRVLPDCDHSDRAAVVWALAVLGEENEAAVDAIIEEFERGRLQVQPGFDPRIIVQVVGVARLATDELVHHESVGVRTLVAQALSEAGTPDVVAPLSSMLEDDEQNIVRIAAAGLGRIGDPSAARPLFELMTRQRSARTVVMDALRRSTGARGLIVLLSSAGDAEIKRQLTAMLRSTHDPAAADALAGLLGSEDLETRLEAAHGLAEIGDARAIPALLTIAQGDNLDDARDALESMLLLESAAVVPALLPMLEDQRFLGRRASIMRVLGRSGAPDQAGPALARHLSGDDIATAALALAEVNYEPAYATLMRMIPRPRNVDFSAYMGMAGVPHEREYQDRTAAVRAIGRYGRPESAAALMTIIEDPQDDIRLRNDAGLALGAVADDEVLRTVLTKLESTDVEDIARRFYLGALWQHPSRTIAGPLLDLINNPATSTDVRRPAAVAVGYAADPANDARLITMLASDETERDAAIAIALGGSVEAATALAARLDGDSELRQFMQETLMNETNDWFNLLTVPLWDSGQVMRRIRVAIALREAGQGFAWNPLIARLRAGWDGAHGLTARDIRMRLFAQLRGDDATARTQAASLLGEMGELGLLMAARDQGGSGADEARAVLSTINRSSGSGGGAAAAGADAEDEIAEE